MPVPFFDPNASLDALRDDLKWLERRLLRDERSRDLAARVQPLVAGWPEVRRQQLEHWDAQLDAQVDVTIADDDLDAAVDAFDRDLTAAVKDDRASPRYRAYFKVPPSELKRAVLGAELETVRGWIPMLDAEPDATLRAHAERLTELVAAADDAAAARTAADGRNTAFRTTGAYAVYMKRAIETREQVWAELELRRAHDVKGELPRDWASRFFRARTSAVSEAERAARAAEREQERLAREATAARKKELEANLKKTRADLAALEKAPKRRRTTG